MPIRIRQALLADLPGAERDGIEAVLWERSAGACAICGDAMDPERDELEAGRAAGGLHLAHARCEHDVVDERDLARLGEQIGDDPAGYLEARGWRLRRRARVEPRAPLLRAATRRRWRWLVEGALGDGSGVRVGCLVLTISEEGGEDEEGVFVDGDSVVGWLVVLLDAVVAPPGYVTLTAHLPELDWMTDVGVRSRVVLESAAFERRVRLAMAVDGDEQAVRAAFTPAVQVALASRGIPDGVRWEAEQGAVLAALGLLGDPDDVEPSAEVLRDALDLLGDALWLRAVVAGDPPGRLPERAALRALALGA